MFAKLIFVLSIVTVSCNGFAQSTIDISLHNNTPLEQDGRQQLERILESYALDDWIFTDKVRIQSRVIPHSHPILTLNTRYLDDDEAQLATFLHEQIHWHAAEDSLSTEKAIATFRTMYPEVPVGDGQGARSTYSTYLHLAVCWLEFDGMRRLVGEKQAREVLAEKTYYRWIYKKVLDESEKIGAVVREYGLVIE